MISAIKMEGVTTGFEGALAETDDTGKSAGTDEQLHAAVPTAGCAAKAGCATMGSISGLGVQQEAISPAGCVINGNARGASWLILGAG